MAEQEDYEIITIKPVEDALAILRKGGWMVAVHNDYKQDGRFMTFWLFTNASNNTYIKGEAPTDRLALATCLAPAGLDGY